jgi:hypothetical protein
VHAQSRKFALTNEQLTTWTETDGCQANSWVNNEK